MSNTRYICIFLLGCVMKNYVYEAYPTFQSAIPNGVSVPSPCDRSMMWPGVGHQSPAGGDARNPFGLDFKANGFNWAAVCQLDSDGDGRTNGEELGDPTCVWQQGQPAPDSTYITHPGICEPLDDVNCLSRNSWLTCPEPFNCPAVHQADVMNASFTLPAIPVPANVTSYKCYGFKFPNDTDYHVIATKPIISNPVVDHHIILFVCKNPPDVDYFTEPKDCPMTPEGCLSPIAIWSPGITGQCLSDEYGFHIGPDGYRYAVLQVHMNNPLMYSGLVDSSGYVIYYTASMRQNDGTVTAVGQEDLSIPPGQPLVSYTATCSSACTTRGLSHPINITSVLIHMHMLGSSGDFSLIKNGETIVLANQTYYDYNAPILHSFDPPYTLHPGDQLHTTCNYDSRGTNKTTYFGEATDDEMCYFFITYYPTADTFPYCTQWRDLDLCRGTDFGCDMPRFQDLLSTLDSKNCTETECPQSCRDAVQEIYTTGCMDGNAGDYLTEFEGFGWLRSLHALCGLDETDTTATML